MEWICAFPSAQSRTFSNVDSLLQVYVVASLENIRQGSLFLYTRTLANSNHHIVTLVVVVAPTP